MRTALVAASVFALAGFSALSAADAIKSGLQPGDRTSAFQTRDITGPNKGKSLCYVWAYGGRPVVLAFAREINGSFTSLVKQIDKTVADNKGADLKSFVVFLTDDREGLEPKVAELATKEKIANVPLTIVEGVAGPARYKVAKDAEVTVILYKQGEAKANFAFGKGELNDEAIKKVVDAAAKLAK